MEFTEIKLNEEKRFAIPQQKVSQTKPSDQIADYLTDDLYESIGSTPVGRLLAMISALPEVRCEKVNDVRRQITDDNYDIPRNLDTALDKVLEEFLMES